MRHRLRGLSTYGLNGHCVGDEHLAYALGARQLYLPHSEMLYNLYSLCLLEHYCFLRILLMLGIISVLSSTEGTVHVTWILN